MRKRRRKRFLLRDPMVLTLIVLLVFLTAGPLFFGNRVRKVGLDAAYGGSADGFTGFVQEAEVTAAIVKDLREILENDSRFEVFETHEAGKDADLMERLEKTREEKADLLLSIHASGSQNTSMCGMQVSALPPSFSHSGESMKLAQCIASAFASDTFSAEAGRLLYTDQEDGTYTSVFIPEKEGWNQGRNTWDLMRYGDCLTVVSDQFFVSSASDVQRWADEDGYAEAARNLYQALCEYYGWNPKEELA